MERRGIERDRKTSFRIQCRGGSTPTGRMTTKPSNISSRRCEALMYSRLQNGVRFPNLSTAAVGGGEMLLPSDVQGSYAVILFYRGDGAHIAVPSSPRSHARGNRSRQSASRSSHCRSTMKRPPTRSSPGSGSTSRSDSARRPMRWPPRPAPTSLTVSAICEVSFAPFTPC
jgi:hypothetical protein